MIVSFLENSYKKKHEKHITVSLLLKIVGIRWGFIVFKEWTSSHSLKTKFFLYKLLTYFLENVTI